MRRLLIGLVVCAACACAPGAATRSTVSPQASASPSTSAQPALLSRCPATQQLGALTRFAQVSGDPDDVTVAPNGVIWLSDRDGLRIVELDAHGSVLRSFADPGGPEGIAVVADGTVIVAQQVTDRLDVLHADSGSFTPWLDLGTTSPASGIDGLGLDGSTVLVPDSAHGRLLSVAVRSDGSAATPSVLATGLGRPVAAVRAPSGGFLIALENNPGLVLVTPGVARFTAAAHFASLDDLVVRGGVVYATDLADGSLLAIDPSTGASRTLVSGASAPQGLDLLPSGDLLLVDSTARELALVPGCG